MKDVDSCNSDNSNSNSNSNGNIEKNGGTSQSQSQSKDNKEKVKNNGEGSSSTTPATIATTASTSESSSQPSPLLKGTLSYNVELRRHVLRGMWNYENSTAFHPQRFELIRNLGSEEDPTELPKDGEFHGSFSLTYLHTTSKGKQRERSKVIAESGVQITFKSSGESKEYEVDGEGTNQFGIFQIYGTASKSIHEGDPTYDVELRKRYTGGPSSNSTNADSSKNSKSKKRKLSVPESEPLVEYPLPPPSQSYPSNVVCLRGKLQRQSNEESGVFHQISGMWSSGLDLIEADPLNSKGLCNRFEYEHKCTVPCETFPLSGRYAGWFNLTTDDGNRTKVNEKDVTLKFKKNNAGYHNIEGRGSNAFGKYSISGVLAEDDIITIFRHFQVRKQKKSTTTTAPNQTTEPTTSTTTTTTQIPSAQQQPATVESTDQLSMTLDDVVIPTDDDPKSPVEAFKPPAHGEYSAVHRGVLRINDDGAHTCSGKWAITREHFNNNCTSNFHFGLEAHHATLGAEAMKKENGTLDTDKITENSNANNSVSPVPPTTLGNTTFPVDSPYYKGSFKMRRGTTKFQSIIDKQIALKFRKNTSGSYNVYGKGVNSIGIFSLVGTVILLGKGSGQVELYRIYPLAAADPVLPQQTTSAAPPSSGKALARAPLPTRELAAAVAAAEKSISDPMQQGSSLSSITPTRKESSRQRKLPSRLEDDNPQAQIARMMEKCTQILKFMKEKDIATGAFFGEPVDPVAQCIPTYHQVIKNPMDLGTVQTRLDAGEIESPEEFARIVKLIFENAMKFNIDATHVVHLAARDLLILFNQKFRDLERMVEIFRKERKPSKAELKESQRKQKEADRERKRKEKDDRFKRKRENSTSSEGEEKRTKLNEMQVAATATAQTLEKLSDKPSGDVSVSRNEFIMVVDTLKQMQQQMMQMQSMFLSAMNNTEKSDTVKNDTATAMTSSSTRNMENHNSTKRKKPKKKTTSNRESDMKSSDAAPEKEAAPVAPVVSDEEKPLTLKEQEDLTEAINSIHPDKLETIIQIIRESATLNDDEEEIDLEIDQLDTSTQRKLQRFVMKNVKPKRAKKTAKQKQVVPAPAKSTSKKSAEQPGIEITPEKKPDPQIDTKANSASFLDYPDSDSDSDSDSDESSKKQAPQKSNDKKDDAFDTNTLHDEEDDELMNANIAPNWNISKPLKTEDEDKDSGDEDDAWNAARNTSAAQKALDKERQAREEKMRLEAEVAKEKHLAEAAKHAEQLRAKRKEKEAEATRLREEKEQEEEEKRKKAREKQMAEVDSVQQTIDIEHQRDLMKELERDYYDKDLAGASPSSDFGF